MKKFLKVETIEVEPITKSSFFKRILKVEDYDDKEEDEEGFLIKEKECCLYWISKKDFENRGYMSYSSLPYPLAYYLLQEKKCDYIRLPHWKEDVKIKAQIPDQYSKMTAPYTYVESRFGNVPHKTTVIEEWDKNWEVHQNADLTIDNGFMLNNDGSMEAKYIKFTSNGNLISKNNQ